MAESDPLVQLHDIIRDLLTWFDHAGVRGVIVGGVAASILGRPRITGDVDAVVLLDDERIPAFLETGRQFGFHPRMDDCVAFAAVNRILLVRHERSGIDADISIAGLAFERLMILEAQTCVLGGISVPLPKPEELIAMKILAHRARDLDDIEQIVITHPNLDRQKALQYATEFAEALAQPEMVEDLKQILAESPRRRPRKSR